MPPHPSSVPPLACRYVGVLTKALLAFNALLSAYVYNSKALHSFGGEDTRVQGVLSHHQD
jgi:hypothetical protein